jgi:hypothetical protein
MLKTITAKFNGRCARTGEAIQRGQTIIYNTATRSASLPGAADYIRPDYVSHVIDFGSGRQYYRNKNGRCEDAPCCGCCTI